MRLIMETHVAPNTHRHVSHHLHDSHPPHTQAKRPMPVENQPAPDLDASPHDLRESYLWRCRYAFLNVINELAQAKDAQAMAHFEWYAFKVPLFGHKVLLPAHVFEFQFWSSLEPILPDLKVGTRG